MTVGRESRPQHVVAEAHGPAVGGGGDIALEETSNAEAAAAVPGSADLDVIEGKILSMLSLISHHQRDALQAFEDQAVLGQTESPPIVADLFASVLGGVVGYAIGKIGEKVIDYVAATVTDSVTRSLVASAVQAGQEAANEAMGSVLSGLPLVDGGELTAVLLAVFMDGQRRAVTQAWGDADLKWRDHLAELRRRPDAEQQLSAIFTGVGVAEKVAAVDQQAASLSAWSRYCGFALARNPSGSPEGQFNSDYLLQLAIRPTHPDERLPVIADARIPGLSDALQIQLAALNLAHARMLMRVQGDVAGHPGRIDFRITPDGQPFDLRCSDMGREYLWELATGETHWWGNRNAPTPGRDPDYDRLVHVGATVLVNELRAKSLMEHGILLGG